MIYAIAFSSFAIGFSLAVILIARVNLHPPITMALRKAGLIRSHKATRQVKETWLEL